MSIVNHEFSRKANGMFTVGILREQDSFFPVVNNQVLINPGDYYRILVMFNGNSSNWKPCYFYKVFIDGKHVLNGGFEPFKRDTFDIYEGPQGGRIERFKASDNQSLLTGISQENMGVINVQFYEAVPKVKEVYRGGKSFETTRGIGTVLDGKIQNEVQVVDYQYTYGEMISSVVFKFNQPSTERML